MKAFGVIIILLVFSMGGCGVGVSDYDDAVLDGASNLNLKKPEKALSDFNRAIKVDNARADGYLGRGDALNILGRYTEALKDYDKAIEIDPSLANAFVNRAIAHSHLGEFRNAIADYEKALALNPEIDDPPGFIKRLFDNTPNREKGIRKHLEYLKKAAKEQESKSAADTG